MEAKCYRAMQRAQGKMLREYFSGVSVENLSRRYGYSVIKIKTMASDFIYQCELTQERRTCHPATSHHKRLNIQADSRNGLCPEAPAFSRTSCIFLILVVYCHRKLNSFATEN